MLRRSALVLLVAALFGPLAHAQEVRELYKKVVRSGVFIVTPSRGGIGMGSGSIVDLEQRIIITNYHVVGLEDWVYVQFPVDDEKGKMITDKKFYLARIRDEKALKGKVLKIDKKRDLAIVKLESAPPPGTPALPLATREPTQGASVFNIGSPGAVEQVFGMTQGTVRGVDRLKFMVGGGDEEFEVEARVITTDNPINQGDSGGPLVNAAGEMVGVSQSGKLGGTVKLVSNFIDVSEVKAFLKENKIDVKVTPPTTVVPPKKDNTDPKMPPKDPPLVKKEPPKDTVNPQAEKASQDALRLTKLLAGNEDSRDKYMEKLQDIVKKYPGTTGAKEAQRLLAGLKK